MQDVKKELEIEIDRKEAHVAELKNEILATKKEIAKLRNIVKKLGGLNA